MPPGAPSAKQIADEDAAIAVRLLTHVSALLKGKPPLFKAVAQSFLAVTEAAQNGSLDSLLAAQAAFQRDLDALELQLNRFQAANDANEREQEGYAAKQEQLEAQIRQAVEDIETKKRELQAARIVRQHNEEYEVIRGMIAEQPQRAVTQAAINEERARIEALREEQRRHQAALEHKRRAFALLLQCIEDLQRTGDEDGGGGGGGGTEGGAGGSGGGPSAMQVDG